MNCDSEHDFIDHGYDNGKNGHGVKMMSTWIVIMSPGFATIYKLMVKNGGQYQ